MSDVAEIDYQDLDEEEFWSVPWPGCQILCNFMMANPSVFGRSQENSVALELGCGLAHASQVALHLGQENVIATDNEIECIDELASKNVPGLHTQVFDLTDERATNELIDSIKRDFACLNYIVASDIFYSEDLYQPIMKVLHEFIVRSFPGVPFYTTFQLRDAADFIFDLGEVYGIDLSLVRTTQVFSEGAYKEIQLIKMTSKVSVEQRPKIYVGVEGGGSETKIAFLREDGTQIGSTLLMGTTNPLLNGFEVVTDQLAKAVREFAAKNNVQLPVTAIGYGMSGAEDGEYVQKFVDYLQMEHGDIAEHHFMDSDATVPLNGFFPYGGVLLISGTGSNCRLLKKSGEMFGCGGWGHILGDEGSGFWIASRAIKALFDNDDGLNVPDCSTDVVRKIVLDHFQVTEITQLLPYFYGAGFSKAHIAKITKILAENAPTDRLSAKVFYDAGIGLSDYLIAVSRHFDAEMRKDVPVLLMGSVFGSWSLMKQAVADNLRHRCADVQKFTFYKMTECSPAVFAAAHYAARQTNSKITAELALEKVSEVVI